MDELQTLGLPSGQAAQGLPQLQVIQSDGHDGLQEPHQEILIAEEADELLRRAFEQIGDREAPHADLQDFVLEAAAFAVGAAQVNIRKELHFDVFEPFAVAVLTAPPRHVEGEVPGRVAPCDGFRGLGEQLSDRFEDPCVGQEVGSRRASDGLLVHEDHLFEPVQTLECVARPGELGRTPGEAKPLSVESSFDERALSRTRNAAHSDQQPQGKVDGDPLQIILPGSPDAQQTLWVGGTPTPGVRNRQPPGKIGSGQAGLTVLEGFG